MQVQPEMNTAPPYGARSNYATYNPTASYQTEYDNPPLNEPAHAQDSYEGYAAGRDAGYISPKKRNARDLPALNLIHILFLFYSGAHNTINAFKHAENGFFFLFVVVGILSVELMLWAIYKYWKEGRLVGRMLLASKISGFLAMFFAVAGILAEAQTGTTNAWLATYYQWILPSSAPMMFVCGFWIQSLDPILSAGRDTQAYEFLLKVETRRNKLDEQRMALNEQRDQRLIRTQLLNLKQNALWKETMSRRTKRQLKASVQKEVPLLLASAGINSSKYAPAPKVDIVPHQQNPLPSGGDSIPGDAADFRQGPS